ncbi:alpha-L-rhamnosidase C-terminal domain-containing protein [Streptomyces sp. NPDC003247]|uniref:alpha-L-rhamnosidase-related protein n=1 Tax=Streptomyces sp. NPDC003247 TaxID=3364677 RepID=UPI0036D1E13F
MKSPSSRTGTPNRTILEVPGAQEDITVEDVTATVVHTAVPRDGRATFASDDTTLNAVFDLMQRSALYSVQETFVDTPTREQGQFLHDTVNISYALMATSGDRAASRQAMREFVQSQARYWTSGNDAGRYNAVYPDGDGKRDIPDFTETMPNWILRYYQETGDRALLDAYSPAVAATAGYVRRHIATTGATEGLVTRLGGGTGQYQYGIVDWPAAGRFGYDMSTAARTTVNALGVDVLRTTGAVARIVGRPEAEAAGCTADADALVARMNATLRTADGTYVDGLLADGTQSGHAGQHASSYALAFGVVPAAERADLAARVGDLGMRQGPMTAHWLLRGLADGGDYAAVRALLTDAEDNGWARIVARGGTFTWESWNDDGDSLSHGWGAQAAVDVQESVLGIETTAPGGKEVRLSIPDTGLSHAAGTRPTQYGTVGSDWTADGDDVSLTATVPVNTSAVVELPATGAVRYAVHGPGGATAEPLGTGDGLVRYRVGSGRWTFSTSATGL